MHTIVCTLVQMHSKREESTVMVSMQRSLVLALFGVACVGLLGIVTISSQNARRTVLVTQYPQTDLDMIAAMVSCSEWNTFTHLSTAFSDGMGFVMGASGPGA